MAYWAPNVGISDNYRARTSKTQVLFCEGHDFHFGTGAEFSDWFI
jgi:hypothetical protein